MSVKLGPPQNAQAQLRPHVPVNGSDWMRRRVTEGYSFTALHETIHFADSVGVYSDRELAQAAVQLDPSVQEEFDKLAANDVASNSIFWDKVLRMHCPGPLVR